MLNKVTYQNFQKQILELDTVIVVQDAKEQQEMVDIVFDNISRSGKGLEISSMYAKVVRAVARRGCWDLKDKSGLSQLLNKIQLYVEDALSKQLKLEKILESMSDQDRKEMTLSYTIQVRSVLAYLGHQYVAGGVFIGVVVNVIAQM